MRENIYNILAKIEENGFKAYVVGGYVRDYLRKKESFDVDICTNATVKDLINIFNNYNFITSEYGTIVLKLDNYRFEITTFRKEISYKNNRKVDKVKYINNLEEDLLRRDFTINTICMDKNGNLIDILDGRKDLNKKIIRVVGDSFTKISEDSLRIMRAVRFATILNFKIDKNLKLAIKQNKQLLTSLSYERKKEELTKIFASENIKYGVELLKELELLDVLELSNINNVLLTKDIIGKWATIIKPNTYPFTKNEKEIISKINELLKEDINDTFILYKYGLYLVNIVCDLKKLNKKKINNIYQKLPIKSREEIKITSEEICDILNTQPGMFLKFIYNDLETMILTNNLKNDKNCIKEYILKTTKIN